jgi:hypothetical protein
MAAMAKEQEYSKLFDKSGGFEKLLGYQIAELLYDFTVRFTERFIPAASRTRDHPSTALRRNRLREVVLAIWLKAAYSRPLQRSWR